MGSAKYENEGNKGSCIFTFSWSHGVNKVAQFIKNRENSWQIIGIVYFESFKYEVTEYSSQIQILKRTKIIEGTTRLKCAEEFVLLQKFVQGRRDIIADSRAHKIS